VGWSAVNMLKSRGDKILPCGKPALIFEIPEVEELC
jgi:hypothetical protein